MNVANILKVADAIEQASVPGLGFNMVDWYVENAAERKVDDMSGHKCGTTACIAGWALAVRDANKPAFGERDVLVAAAKFLGFENVLGYERYSGPHWHLFMGGRSDTTPEQAVRCLRNLAITGKVDWDAAMKNDDPVLPPVPVKAKRNVRA